MAKLNKRTFPGGFLQPIHTVVPSIKFQMSPANGLIHFSFRIIKDASSCVKPMHGASFAPPPQQV